MKQGYVEYSSNNSGGEWWLNDQNWKDLEAAGWKVVWATLTYDYNKAGNYKHDPDGTPALRPITEKDKPLFLDEDGRYLGALARAAYRSGLSLREAAEEWERVTGLSATDAGCPCCGQPHNFTEYNAKGEYVKSGPEISYSASW